MAEIGDGLEVRELDAEFIEGGLEILEVELRDLGEGVGQQFGIVDAIQRLLKGFDQRGLDRKEVALFVKGQTGSVLKEGEALFGGGEVRGDVEHRAEFCLVGNNELLARFPILDFGFGFGKIEGIHLERGLQGVLKEVDALREGVLKQRGIEQAGGGILLGSAVGVPFAHDQRREPFGLLRDVDAHRTVELIEFLFRAFRPVEEAEGFVDQVVRKGVDVANRVVEQGELMAEIQLDEVGIGNLAVLALGKEVGQDESSFRGGFLFFRKLGQHAGDQAAIEFGIGEGVRDLVDGFGGIAIVPGGVFAGEDVFQLGQREDRGLAFLVFDAVQNAGVDDVLIDFGELFDLLAPVHGVRGEVLAGLLAEHFFHLFHIGGQGYGEREGRFDEGVIGKLGQKFGDRGQSEQLIPIDAPALKKRQKPRVDNFARHRGKGGDFGKEIGRDVPDIGLDQE